MEQSTVDENIKGGTSFFLFKVSLLKMGCPHANSRYTYDPVGIRCSRV